MNKEENVSKMFKSLYLNKKTTKHERNNMKKINER